MNNCFRTDFDRWLAIDSFSVDWDRRAKAVSAFLPERMTVLDIGCGRMALEPICNNKGCRYIPADLVGRDERTIIVDLNREGIPADILESVDVVTLLGVVEYIEDFKQVLKSLIDMKCACLFTYCATDFYSKSDNLQRYSKDGWFNSYSISDICFLIRGAGFKIERFDIFDSQQCVFLIIPTNSTLDLKYLPYSIKSGYRPPVASTGRQSLVLTGFFGRGNAGDEALLQCIFETFSEYYDIVVSVDEFGAYRGFWDWYPYNCSRIIHQCANSLFFENPGQIAGLIVGGGGLPAGFCANLVVAAKVNRIPTFLIGVDLYEADDPISRSAVAEYVNLFDFFSYRSECDDSRLLGMLRCEHALGADWALKLIVDKDPGISKNINRAIVVIREYPNQALCDDYFDEIKKVFDVLEKHSLKPVLVPFCPEDMEFIRKYNLAEGREFMELWSNPRKLKQLIAASRLLLSVGRLHPLLFGVDCCVPIVAISPHVKGYQGLLSDKITRICRDFGIPYLKSANYLERQLSLLQLTDQNIVQASKRRLDSVVEKIFRKLCHE